MPPSTAVNLPPLREDLRLHEAAPNADGSPAWVIQDPVNNVFYRIGWLEFEMLSRWHLRTSDALLSAARVETLLDPTEIELQSLLAFLEANHLLAIHGRNFTDHLVAQHRNRLLSRTQWLLHHYLFFRIPLWHPDRLLQSLSSRLLPYYRPAMLWMLLAFCILGVALAARQWDIFATSLLDTLTPGGIIGYLLALALAKSIHEFAHALTATRYGVRVAHMGVAFIVLWPMLYTDTSESWRLKDRRERLAIASAGIASELVLAGLATLLWSIAPPGDLRQALFFLATTAWIISLGINASPFMRFDGYFILSDILDLPNLHERSFAIARTWLRNRLLGWTDPDPEEFSSIKRRLLITFAILTWAYRLVVFIGIALTVYFFFFKLLGILLFLIEIGWFVVRPIYNEIKVWKARRGEITPSRRLFATVIVSCALVVGLMPWNLNVTADAWAHARHSHVFYSPLPAQIVDIPNQKDQAVIQAGTPLFVLNHPESQFRARAALAGTQAIDSQLAGLGGLPDGEQKRPLLEKMRATRKAEALAQLDESERLHLTAPFDGLLVDVDPQVQPGVWVPPQQALAGMIEPGEWQAEAFVGQSDLDRVAVGNRVLFYPEDERLFPVRGKVTSIEATRISMLPSHILSSRHDGSIAVLPDNSGLTPRDPLFRVRIDLDTALDRSIVRRGSVLIDARSRSWLIGTVEAIVAVLVREASF